jgi:hypothetical protein
MEGIDENLQVLVPAHCTVTVSIACPRSFSICAHYVFQLPLISFILTCGVLALIALSFPAVFELLVFVFLYFCVKVSCVACPRCRH